MGKGRACLSSDLNGDPREAWRVRKESSRLEEPQEGPGGAGGHRSSEAEGTRRLAGRPGAVGRSWCGNQAGKEAGISSGLNRTGFGFGDFILRAVTPGKVLEQRDDAGCWVGRETQKEAGELKLSKRMVMTSEK